MSRDAEEKLLRLRVPVSETYWRDYGATLALVAGGLLALVLLLAESAVEGATAVALYLGLSLGAILAGLAVYNVVVAVLLATQR